VKAGRLGCGEAGADDRGCCRR